LDRYLEPSNPLPEAWINFLPLVHENEKKAFNKVILLLDKKFPISILLSDDYQNILFECYVHDLRQEKEDVKQYLYSLLLMLNDQSIYSYGIRLGVGDDNFIKIHQEISLLDDPFLEIENFILSIKEKSKEFKKIINMLHEGE
jgi:hypothetical protein